ncbi:hypothetical protein [Prolixibacter sp. NT017]|uniref:hypothetical protein n=1 Tax=Prolixibacter sp. NT017 TaxID=2652390 RepID=UPI001298F201|nr:hypothetical protein [Prolixibacter sp. NT017]
MTNKQKKVAFIVVLVLAYAVYMLYCEVTSSRIEKHGRFTVGIVTDFGMNFRNGYTVNYEYTVSGIHYKESLLVSEDYDNIVKHRFFIKFDPEQPKHSKILLDKPASSKFWNVPSDGWIKMPE